MTAPADPTERIIDALTRNGHRVKQTGGQWITTCPAHHDHRPSLAVRRGDDGRALVHCHAGCPTDAVLSELGMHGGDLFPPDREPRHRRDDVDLWLPCHTRGAGAAGHAKVAEYPYRDPDGKLIFAVTRCQSKCFAQWRPDPTSRSGRRWGITDQSGRRIVPYLPYRLPELLSAKDRHNIWVVEGEKSVDRLSTIGIYATCNNGGAGKWTEQHAQWLAGADVIICLDRDLPGLAHAELVAATLLPHARSIEVVQPVEGKDIDDHLDAGLTIGQLRPVGEPLPDPGVPA